MGARVDAVILTAIIEEFEAARAALEAANARLAPARGPFHLPIWYAELPGVGPPLRILLAVAADMGTGAAIASLAQLIERHRPQCVAMCGVCAGHKDKTQLGDVIASDRVFRHDTGKQRPGDLQQDLVTHQIPAAWKLALQAMRPAQLYRGRPWFEQRPLSDDWRALRALAAFLQPTLIDRREWTDPTLRAGDWAALLDRMHGQGWLDSLRVTRLGQETLAQALCRYEGRLPDLSPGGELAPLRLHVAPIGSGARVIEDPAIWGFVSASMRKTLAIEMEASALGEITHYTRTHRVDFLVIKGVMDHAEEGRDDRFKPYAARVSAEVLLTFLRSNLPPRAATAGDDSEGPDIGFTPEAAGIESRARQLERAYASEAVAKPLPPIGSPAALRRVAAISLFVFLLWMVSLAAGP